MVTIIVRGANGVVSWRYQPTGTNSHDWICTRDEFVVHGPRTAADLEATLVALNQHSQQLVCTVAQVVQMDV